MKPLFAPVALLALAGCARFPIHGTSDYTHLIFRFRLNGPVSPDYGYYVAIRPLRTGDTQTDTLGPIPVVTTGSRNGIVAGRPTRLIEFAPERSSSSYLVYGFENSPKDDSDPDPGTLALLPDEAVISGLDPTSGGPSDTLGFEITTQDLGEDAADARSIVAIQFNILTMNRTALNSGDVGSRVIDSLGDQGSTTDFNHYERRLITTSGTFTNAISSYPGTPSSTREPADDTYNGKLPAIDIVDWSLEVRPQ